MKILLTGASGLLGHAYAQAAVRRGHSVTALYNQNPPIASGLVRTIQLDAAQPESLTKLALELWPDAIVNCAAISNPATVDADPKLAEKVNVALPRLLSQLSTHLGARLLHVSTDMVFSHGDPDTPIPETARPSPNSVYGESKLEGEMQVRAAGGRHCVARVSWLFSDEGESFVSKILAVGAKRDQLDLVDDEYGRPTHVDPIAAHLVQLAQMLAEGTAVPGLLHLGPPDPVSRYGWATEIFSASDKAGGPSPGLKPVPGSHFPTPAARARGVILDVNQADALLGPMPDWQSSSKIVVRRLLEQSQ
jgi:dTDP-4-dehydrorhamnose reductase